MQSWNVAAFPAVQCSEIQKTEALLNGVTAEIKDQQDMQGSIEAAEEYWSSHSR